MNETIGWAVKQLHNGSRVRRVGWNGKGMWLVLAYSVDDKAGLSLPYRYGLRDENGQSYLHSAPAVFMKAANGDFVPWLCSQTDLLATDWEIADEEPAVKTGNQGA